MEDPSKRQDTSAYKNIQAMPMVSAQEFAQAPQAKAIYKAGGKRGEQIPLARIKLSVFS